MLPPPNGLQGQALVIREIARLVDAWRGFPLGSAAEPYPVAPPRYEPASDGEHRLTGTSLTLLLHWFRREPHTIGYPPHTSTFKYWPHQRRLVETFIYLHEVRGIRRVEQLWALAGAEGAPVQRDPWAKLGGQLATGSGKTKMMSLLIAWAYLNAVREPDSGLGFGRHAILIAPGLFVRDRLLQDFFPEDDRPPVFWSDPVIPPELEGDWDLKVYSPDTCPLKLDPEEGALVVTNYHQLLRMRDAAPDLRPTSAQQRQMELLFEDAEPSKLEAIQSPLLDRFARSRGLLVLNDEAHHVWDETGHAQFEQKAKAKSGEDAEAAMAWIRAIRRLNGDRDAAGRVALQVDLSATLFQEQGAKKTAGKTSGYETVEFRGRELFRHTAVLYGLAEAIRDGIVKKPVMERVIVRDKKTGHAEELIDPGAPDAWAKYRNLLVTGIERWKKVRDQLAEEGNKSKPILFILCNDRSEAREIANYLSHGQAVRDDWSDRIPTGYLDATTGKRLFVEEDESGIVRSTVIEIHIGQKEESNEAEWEKIRRSVNAIDLDEIPDPEGRTDDLGRPLLVPNPYNVVVSVMMLKEGWDVRNVKVIVPTRPCDSRTLTEQTLGRGLRKMYPPILGDDGLAELHPEELYVMQHPSFKQIIQEIEDLVDVKDTGEIDHPREYVPVELIEDLAAREQVDVRLVRFEGLREVRTDWRSSVVVSKLPDLKPRRAWKDDLPEKDVRTYLQRALAPSEDEGQSFTLSDTYTFRDFDHVVEAVYVRPMLTEMRASLQHKNAVKEIVKEYLERKTFALPAGIPISFDKILGTDEAPIAFGNLARSEVIEAVRKTLAPILQAAINAERPATPADLSVRRSAVDLRGYQALKRHLLEAPRKSAYRRAAMDSGEERRFAQLLDQASDVTGWVYNHRQGVGYSISYDWQGYTAHYFPDFIVRAKLGQVFHNFIIEVKGRLDDRDKAKAKRGRRYCETLTEHDREPWHYLLLIENEASCRTDITWWEQLSAQEIGRLLQQHESLPLYPDEEPLLSRTAFQIVDSVPDAERYQIALPVLDLAASAGAFSGTQSPEPVGWARVKTSHPIDRSMFAARVVGESMEPGVLDGSWAIFRMFAAGAAPPSTALDGRRVIVQLRDEEDPDTGGRYTFKRWRVTKLGVNGGAEEIELRADNPAFKARRFRAGDDDIRVLAEFVEAVR
jgi:type III restriction enzyme